MGKNLKEIDKKYGKFCFIIYPIMIYINQKEKKKQYLKASSWIIITKEDRLKEIKSIYRN